MTPLLLALAMSTALPTTSVQNVCRNVQSFALPEDRARSYQGCIKDETAAREELVRRWAEFSASARADCSETAGGTTHSYVEILTCLEAAAPVNS